MPTVGCGTEIVNLAHFLVRISGQIFASPQRPQGFGLPLLALRAGKHSRSFLFFLSSLAFLLLLLSHQPLDRPYDDAGGEEDTGSEGKHDGIAPA